VYLERAIYVPAPRLHEKVKLVVCSEDQVAAPINLDLPPEEVGWNDCMFKLKHFIYQIIPRMTCPWARLVACPGENG